MPTYVLTKPLHLTETRHERASLNIRSFSILREYNSDCQADYQSSYHFIQLCFFLNSKVIIKQITENLKELGASNFDPSLSVIGHRSIYSSHIEVKYFLPFPQIKWNCKIAWFIIDLQLLDFAQYHYTQIKEPPFYNSTD